MMDNKGISALQIILILAVLVSLPVFFFLGQLGLVFIAIAIAVIVAIGALVARSRRPNQPRP